MPAQDSLLQAPGPMQTILQHLDIVVGLDHQHVRGADAFDHQPRDVAKVRDEAERAGAGAEEKADRVLRVVRNGEGFHREVADFKTAARDEQAIIEPGGELVVNLVLRRTIAINRDVQFLGDADESLDMVAVLVGNQDGREVFRGAADAREAFADLPRAEPRIHQYASFIGLQVSGIAGRTAAEDGQFDGHLPRLGRHVTRDK